MLLFNPVYIMRCDVTHRGVIAERETRSYCVYHVNIVRLYTL